LTEFISKNPQNRDIQSIARRIKLATGIDVIQDKIKLKVAWNLKGEIIDIMINQSLTPDEDTKMLTEFPELKLS